MKIFLKTVALVLATAFSAMLLSSACGGSSEPVVTLKSIAVTPAAPSLAAGATQQFTATGTRSDNSTVDLTATATWASSDTAVAAFETPDTNGLATAIAAGSSTISATDPDSGISSTDSGSDSTVTVTALSGTIKALYPTNGADWNDYVKNDGADMFKATDTACNPATDGPGYNACLNGGPLRTVDVTGRTICDDLFATDSLGAFNWVCDDTTNDVRMVSVGFAKGKGLSDLIDFDTASWKQMNVTVYRGGNAYLATDMAAWWGNTIVVNNTGAAMNEGEVHIVTANNVNDYNILANKVALLIKPGLTITGPAGFTNLIDASSVDFLWIEGSVDATGKEIGVLFDVVRFSHLRNVKSSNGNAAGINLTNSPSNRISYTTAANNTDSGIYLDNSSNNMLSNVSSTNSNNEGVELVNASADNIIIDATSASNNEDGLYVLGASNNVFANLSTPIGTYGVFLGNASNNNTFMNINVVNGGDSGVWFRSNSNQNTVANLISAYSGCEAIFLDTSSNNYFTGAFLVGNDGTCPKICYVTGGTNPGVNDTSCTQNGSSDYGTPVLNPDITNSFVAKVSSDTINANGATGTEAFGSITDWVNFENMFRGWGNDGNAFPDLTNRDPCTAGTCRIWDWSLTSTDTVARDVLSLPTGDDTLTHTWSDASTITFLRNSVEIMEDGVGNENGLCESNETCLFTPNIGSYQGHGNLVSAGAFTDGTITGVTLMQYETNGI